MREVHFRPSASDDLTRAYQTYRDLDDRDIAERLLHEASEAFERRKLLAHAYQPSALTPAGRRLRRSTQQQRCSGAARAPEYSSREARRQARRAGRPGADPGRVTE